MNDAFCNSLYIIRKNASFYNTLNHLYYHYLLREYIGSDLGSISMSNYMVRDPNEETSL